MAEINPSMSLSNPMPPVLNGVQKIATAVGSIGLLFLMIAWAGVNLPSSGLILGVSFALIATAILLFAWQAYMTVPEGIKNNGVFFSSIAYRGILGWGAGILITGFYVCLYWFPSTLEQVIRMHDGLSMFLRGKAADQWFVYGTFYTFAVIFMGIKFILKYKHNTYQIIRTISVMFFQLGFAFLLPAFLATMNQPEEYFSYFWPLDSYALRPDWIAGKADLGTFGYWIIGIGIALPFVVTPILTYLYGKRWYCSWVCGCGGLAETAGDPFRQLSDKSLKAWKIERWMIYSVLVAVVLLTVLLWVNHQTHNQLLGGITEPYKKAYGFLIAQMFSGVIGVGFYPIMGSRVWCRFGCPMAALLGLQQKFFSRFRITTNGGQCISCGNCSTYCEMGIDVRSYAQKGQNVVRASCVGCGICAAVCPRGVLRLENGSVDINQRTEDLRTIHITEGQVKILSMDA